MEEESEVNLCAEIGIDVGVASLSRSSSAAAPTTSMLGGGRHATYTKTDASLLHMNRTAGVRQRFGQADRGGLRWRGGCGPRRPGGPRAYGRGECPQVGHLRTELFTSGAPRQWVLSG